MKTTLLRTAGLALLVSAAAAPSLLAQDQPPPPPPPEESQPPPPPPSESQPPAAYPGQEAPISQAPIASILLPAGLTHAQVQSAILAALQHREWQIVSTGRHTVVGHLLHHHVDATVTMSFNRGRVDFYSESYLVGHHPDDRIASFTREDWIRNLEHDIRYYALHGTMD